MDRGRYSSDYWLNLPVRKDGERSEESLELGSLSYRDAIERHASRMIWLMIASTPSIYE